MKKNLILGISAFYHDSAAALTIDGNIVAAAQEERFTRKKHDAEFPLNAVKYCLQHANLKMDEIEVVCFYEKPFSKFERILETYLNFAPGGYPSFRKAMPLWLRDKIFQKAEIQTNLNSLCELQEWRGDLIFSEHHLSHAASAFYPSPFNDALVLTMDGVGEWTTSSVAIGAGSELKIIKEIKFPHSLGLLYSAFTYFTGFKVNSGEYKVMGLAPYGKPRFQKLILEKLIDLKDDGSFLLNQKYFGYCTGLGMTNNAFEKLIGVPRRSPKEPLEQVHMDLAASIQAATEEIILRLARHLQKESGQRNLCLAGGVALNCVANGKIYKERIFERIWVQPAAGDSGGALGAALVAQYQFLKQIRRVADSDSMKGSYLGPGFSNEEIEEQLLSLGARFQKFSEADFLSEIAGSLSQGRAIGWFQGRMEYGPRALGARSILADARSSSMQSSLNLKVKYRESFRPFAPAILKERASEWFEYEGESPYMLMVSPVKESKRRCLSATEENLFGIEKLKIPRSEIPAVTHVDYSARIQTVDRSTNPRFHKLITEFERVTGCPVLVNTSFNVRGEPIVCTPSEAFRCFMDTELDVLAIGDFILFKEDQDPLLKGDYLSQFELD